VAYRLAATLRTAGLAGAITLDRVTRLLQHRVPKARPGWQATVERLSAGIGFAPIRGGRELVSAEKINGAIHECLASVYGKDAILARIEAFLDSLREHDEWSESELHVVEGRRSSHPLRNC